MPVPYPNLIIDMDGVLWKGDEPLPGLHAFFALLRRDRVRFALTTNNSTRTIAEYGAKLSRMGVVVEPREILTSAQGAAAYIAEEAPAGSTVFAIGEDGLIEALREHGLTLVDEAASAADYVAVGWDRQLTWSKLRRACLLLRAGARFVGTNPDRTFPTPEGLVPGNGAQLAALQAATDISPVIVGKPEPLLYHQALKRLGADPAETAALGDRLDTDILGGQRAGLHTILVLSGVTTAKELARSALQPDEVYADIDALAREWSA